MNFEKELRELLSIVTPIISEVTEQWSNGEDCYQSAFNHIAELSKRLPIIIPYKDLEILTKETINYQKRIKVYYEKQDINLMQIDGNVNLYHVDRGGNPTKPSLYNLSEPLDFN